MREGTEGTRETEEGEGGLEEQEEQGATEEDGVEEEEGNNGGVITVNSLATFQEIAPRTGVLANMSEIKPTDPAATNAGDEKDCSAAKPKPQNAVTIAVSSRTLFNMVAEQNIYEEEGVENYVTYQQEHENEPLMPGLTIERFFMTGGQSPIGYLNDCMTNLYLSKDGDKVTEAIEEGIAAATMFTSGDEENQLSDTQLKVAFDGDGVLFSDESEIIFKQHGLDRFIEHEMKFEDTPLPEGPLKCFLEALVKLQRKFKNERENCPIRTYLVTSRGEDCGGARVHKTLRLWDLEIDDIRFLKGAPKGPVLQEIQPHIFFDDQMVHINAAIEVGTIAAHVPYGVG
ncbi:unnamed protein product [Coregonus sp. 'balchen']|nr:unnamed protein product [Coregonus sp. 'balchen']